MLTDHKALQWLLNFDSTKKRLYRWSQELSLYSFEVIHRPGRQMTHVDALSRAPVNLFLRTEDVLIAQNKDLQNKSHYILPFRTVTNIDQLDKQEYQAQSKYKFFRSSEQSEQLTKKLVKGQELIVVPPSMIRTILSEAHDNCGHPSTRKTTKQIQFKYYWPSLRTDVQKYIQTCTTCQLIKPSSHPPFGKLKPIPTPAQPLELLGMDTIIMGTASNSTKAKCIPGHHRPP